MTKDSITINSIKDDPELDQLRLELKSLGIDSIPDSFFCCLDEALVCYEQYSVKLSPNIQDKSDVIDSLKNIHRLAKMLETSINDLNSEAHDVVTLEGNIIESIQMVCNVIEQYTYSPRGRPIDIERIELAVNIADCVEKHLGVKPTSTKEGVYEKVLTFALERATRHDVKSVSDLAIRALKEIKNSPKY